MEEVNGAGDGGLAASQVAVEAAAAVGALTMTMLATTDVPMGSSGAGLNVDLFELDASAALFANMGICVFESVLSTALIDDCRRVFEKTSARVDAALASRGIGDGGRYFGHEVNFNEVCQRGRERLDVRTGMHDDSLGDALLHGESAPWMPFVRRVLGEAAHECFRGVMDSRPGSVAQEWHSDGHEWDEALEGGELPTEARRLTLFIPLVDLGNPRCGATQYFPGSHLVAVDHAANPAWCMPTPNRGSIIAFDYRTVHRGGANTRLPGEATRPMMHIVYARTGYDAKYEVPTNRPLFVGVGSSEMPLELLHSTRLTVRCSADLRLMLTKGTEGKVVLLPADPSSETDPYTIAERSVHESSMDVSSWIQRAMTHLVHEIPFERLPAEAKQEALKQVARLKACLALEDPFVVRLDDPTAESWVHLPP